MTSTPSEVLDQYPLELIQAKPYSRRFALRRSDDSYVNFHDYTPYAQVRTKEDPIDGELIIDLTPHLSVTDDTLDDGKFLDLYVPGEATALIGNFSQLRNGSAYWDIFIVDPTDHRNDDRLFQGPASMDYSATDMREAEA